VLNKTSKILAKRIGKTEKILLNKLINKIRRFLLNQDEFGSNFAVEKYTKISVEIRISTSIYIHKELSICWSKFLLKSFLNDCKVC